MRLPSDIDTGALRRPQGRDALRVAILLWVFVAGIFVVALRNAPVAATGVAVFIAYEGEPRREFLGDATTEILSAALDGLGPLLSVPPWALVQARMGADKGPTEEEARAIAGQFEASHFILGTVALEGDEVTLEVTLHETDGPRSRLFSTEGDLQDFATLLNEVSAALAARIFGTGGSHPGTTDGLYSASLPALEAFFRAERSFRAGRFGQAGSLYDRAIRDDPDFALAHHRLSLTAERLDRYVLARQAGETALRLSQDLGPRHRLLIRAQAAWLTGDSEEAELVLGNLVSEYPNDPDAWARVSEIQFHGAAFRGLPVGIAREATENVLRLDPSNAEALDHAAHIAMASGEAGHLAGLADRAQGLDEAPSLALTLQAIQEAMGGPVSAATLDRLRDDDGTAAMDATRALATAARNMEAALRTVALLTDENRPPGVRALGEIWTAFLQLAKGRRGLADEAFDRAADLDPDLAVEHRALAYTLPFLRYDAVATRRLAARMDRWRPGGARTNAEPEPHYLMHLQSRPVLAPYLAGRLSLATGDTAAARLWAAEVDAAPWSPDDPPLPRALAAGLRAELAHLTGDAEGALDTLQAAYTAMSYRLRQPSMLLSLARERWLMADLLEGVGRVEDAMRWFLPYWGRIGESVFVAPSYYRRGLLREATGDINGARADYRRFVDIWSDADAELQGWVDDAAARIAALPGG